MSSNLKSNNKVDLNLVILDNKCTEEEYNEFIVQYKKNSKDLCLKKNGTKTQNILTYLFERKLENINIYYILLYMCIWDYSLSLVMFKKL